MLPVDLIAHIVVFLNDGTVGDKVIPKYGYMYPGKRGGRELQYFQISREAMTFWQHVCKYMRLTYRMHDTIHYKLLSDTDFDLEDGSRVPRHLYAGNLKPWISLLCYEDQCGFCLWEGEGGESTTSNAY